MRQVLDYAGSPCFVQLIQLKFQLLFANCVWWRYLKYLTFLVALIAADPWKSQVTLKDVAFVKGIVVQICVFWPHEDIHT